MPNSPLRPRSDYVPPVGENPLRPNGGLFFEEDLVRATVPETADVRRGLSSALASAASGHHSGVALKAAVAGDTALQQQALRQAELADRRASIYAPRVSSLRDAQDIGDVGSFIAGAAPGAIADTLPALAAGLAFRGRGRFSAPTALAGAAVPSYYQQFGEMAREQRLDPTLSEASAEDRLRSARLGAAGGTVLEALLPGKLANDMLRVPSRSLLRNTAVDALTEGATETAQTGVQHLAHRSIDNTRELDGWDLLDSAVAGTAGGGGLSAAARAPAHGARALVDRFARGQEGGAPVQEQPMDAAPSDAPLLPAPDDGSGGGGAGGLFDTLNERFGPGLREQAQKTKDYVSDTIDRMGEAIKTAQTPDEFLRQVFSSSPEDAAAADLLHDTEDPGVMNAADPAAAMQQRDAERQERAAFFAEELLNDPATPDAVKERVASFGGDFTDPEARAFVARTLVAQRAGEKLTNAVNDLIDLTKDFGGKARDMLNKSMSAATDRIVKKNLQGGDEPGSGVTQFPTHRTRRTDRQQDEDFVESEFAAVVANQEKAVAEAEARVERAKRLNTGRMAEIVAVARTMPPEVFEGNPVYENMTPLERRAFHSITEADEELALERSVLNDMRKSLEPAKASSTTDRIVKKSLQGISLVDAKPLVDTLAQRLGPSGAAKAPELARKLLALSVRMSSEGRITPEMDSRLRSLSDVIDDDVLDMVTEASGSDGLRQSLARIREIPSAQTDVATSDGSSFLESMLVRPLSEGQRKQLAKVIDEAGLQLKGLNPTRRDQLLTGLAAAFGSEGNAQTVIEYYGNLKREAMQRRAESGSDPDDLFDQPGEDAVYEAPRPTGDAYEGTDDVAEFGTLPERDAPEQDTYYADAKSMRPFYEGREGRLSTEGGTRRRVRDVEAFMDRMQGRGVKLRAQRYGDFLKERNEDGAAAVKRIRKDLEKRIAEAAPRKGEAAEYAEGRTKNRQYLEEQLLALNLIEKADGPEAAANLFSVARAVGERNELGITDAQLAKADTLLRRTVDPKKPPRGMTRRQAEKHNRDIVKTKIVFNRHDGAQPLVLSAESLWKAYAKGQPAGRSVHQLFADAVSAVLNRPDIAGLSSGLDGVLIDRASGTYAEPRVSDEVRAVKKELAHEYEARLSEAESQVEAAASEIEDARDGGPADDELVERIEVAAAELQREADAGRVAATALKDEAKAMPWEDGAPPPEAIELRARAAWEHDISRVFAEGARDLHETATEVRSELDRVEDGSNDAHTGNEFRRLERRRNDLQHAYDVAYDSGNEAAIEDAKRRLDAVGEAIKRMEAREAVERAYGSAGRTARAERGAAAKVRNYDETTGAALHPDDKPSAAKPKGLGKRLDAALLANPELLEVLDARGQPKDKAMTESRMRENLFKAYSAVKTPALKARLEGLRAKYQEAKNASNVGTPAAREAAKQEAAALKEIGQMVRWILERRESSNAGTESAPKRVVLPKTGPYTAKDQAKSDKATQFIGRGSPKSSTAAYAAAWGDRANTGKYSSEDVVFVSAEGARTGRVSPDWALIKAAADAGVTFITDKAADREERSHNVGERSVAEALRRLGYVESAPGTWTPGDAARSTEKRPEKLNVWAGSGENRELSNLAPRPFDYDGRHYFSVEHAYQTLKSGTFDAATYAKYSSGGFRKIPGRAAKTEGGYNVALMERLMSASFEQNPDAMDKLRATGVAEITHEQDRGIWREEFPRILMEIRDRARSAEKRPGASQQAPKTSQGKVVKKSLVGAKPSGVVAPFAANNRPVDPSRADEKAAIEVLGEYFTGERGLGDLVVGAEKPVSDTATLRTVAVFIHLTSNFTRGELLAGAREVAAGGDPAAILDKYTRGEAIELMNTANQYAAEELVRRGEVGYREPRAPTARERMAAKAREARMDEPLREYREKLSAAGIPTEHHVIFDRRDTLRGGETRAHGEKMMRYSARREDDGRQRVVHYPERTADEIFDDGPAPDPVFLGVADDLVEASVLASKHASQQASRGKAVKKSFVGAKADPEGASDAEKLLGIGAPADVVWRDLGWFRGPDGKLRKEIRSPVLRRRVRDFATAVANGSRKAIKVRDLLEGIDAFKPYLDKLGDLPINPNDSTLERMGAIGMYIGEEGVANRGIGLSRVNAELAVRINAVPNDKGMDLLRAIADSLLPVELEGTGLDFVDLRDVNAEFEARYPMPDIKERVADQVASTLLHELQHAFQHAEGFENGGNAFTAVVAKYGDADEYLAAIRDGDDATAESIAEQAFAQMRAEVGPDGDMEAVAYKLYESIIGEVEANDVAARMNLSDEEAASVKPALMDAEREFVRSVLLAEVLSTFRSKVGSSKMGGRPGRPGKNWGDKEAVKAEILRLRGKDVKVAVEKLVKQLGGSGQYTYDPATGERLIEVAVNARSPVGTARHEAMHDLFRFLSENDATRSVAKDLRDATSAPHVIRQLRDLLKNDKAALEQLNDPEERAAYAYQFWAEGLLRIGPTGTGIFHTIRQFIKDLFGIVTAGQRGEDLMRAFHDGKFADPSIVQEVLQDINDSSGDRVANKLNRAAPALTRALNSLLSAAPERLRRFENDYLNELADKFQPEKGTGFVQNRFQQEGVWTNRLGGILRGTTAVERREAIDQLQAMKPTSKLAKELAKFNEDIYEYMRDAGVQSWDSTTKKFVPLRKVQGYFTRSWDPDAIARNRPEFEALLRTEGGVSAANAAALVENLVRGSEQRPKPKESPVDLGFMPYAPHTSERVLTFINPGNADKFAKFQRKDLADIMMSYVRGSTHRAEYAREFGNNGEKIVDLVAKSGIKDTKELEEISNAVQAMEGSLDPGNWSVQTKEAMSAVLTLQNVTLLPLALVSQMIDPIVLAARTGDIKDAGTAYVTALKRLKNTITKSKNKVPGEELAEILGVVSEYSTLQAMAMAYGTTRMSKRMENINRVFFKYNGMQGWNNSMRIAATAAGEKYLLAHRKDAKALAELGLEPKDIKSVGGKLDVSNPKVQQAMFQFVDQAVLRPSAANRPVWMSDPRFLLVAHLKQFTFAMHNVVLKRANRELQNDNPKPWGVLMLAMPVILAADMAKFALTGRVPAGWEFKDYVMHAVERSGLMGISEFGVQAMDRVGSGKMPGEELLGPTFEHLMEILRWIGGDPRTDFGDVVDRTVPGARFI